TIRHPTAGGPLVAIRGGLLALADDVRAVHERGGRGPVRAAPGRAEDDQPGCLPEAVEPPPVPDERDESAAPGGDEPRAARRRWQLPEVHGVRKLVRAGGAGRRWAAGNAADQVRAGLLRRSGCALWRRQPVPVRTVLD